MSRPVFGSVIAAVLAGGTWSCAALLGIEDATCDPAFDADCSGTAVVPLFPVGSGGDGGNGSAGAAGSATGGSSAATAAGGNAGTSGVAAEPLCVRYCRTVAANCTGDYKQYASEDTCLAVCESLEPGTAGVVSGNTVECRLARAVLATRTGEPVDYCFSAGPGGGGVCGNDCDAYCDIMTETCDDLGSREDCLDACALIPDRSAPPESLLFSTAVQAGDSLQCRLFHVSAATVDPVGHCVHAAGLAVCN